jgi:hypothetical protein
MARRARKSSRKRARQRQWLDEETSENLPRDITVDLDRLPKEVADTARRMIAQQAAAEAAPVPRAFINQRFGQQPQPKPKSKRKTKYPGGRKRDWNYAGIEKLTKNYIKTHGRPRTATLLIEKVNDACKVAGILFDAEKTQCKEIVRGVFHRAKKIVGNSFRLKS